MSARSGGRARQAVALTVFAVVTGLVVAVAIMGDSFKDRVMDLHNSGIWVTNDDRGLFGRINRSAGGLDAALADSGQGTESVELDVFQDGEAVIGWSRSQGKLFSVDTKDALISDDSMTMGPLSAVAMGGQVVASVSVDSGEVRLGGYSPAGLVDLSDLGSERPAAEVIDVLTGPRAGVDIAVDDHGVVFAASTAGATVLIDQDKNVVTGSVGRELQSVMVSVVNGVGVVADRVSGDVFLSTSQQPYHFGDHSLVVPQQAGGDADQVVVATGQGLYAIPLSGGDPIKLFESTQADPLDRAQAAPARPVALDSAVYGAWGGAPGRVVKLANGQSQESVFPVDGTPLVSPVFRVNRGSILLNDMATGGVFAIEEQRSLDQWDTVDPLSTGTSQQSDREDESLPLAADDHLWVRPGRVSVLHVLDNDRNPGSGIVAITHIEGPDADRVSIFPDGQTLVVETPADQAADMRVTYTVTNRGVDSETADTESSANVTISMRGPGENNYPELFAGLGADPTTPDFVVASGGTLSIAPAWAWRDADSDPVVVLSADVAGRALPVTGQGLIQYAAPVTASGLLDKIEYQVSDGSGVTVDAQIYVQVLSSTAVQGVAPVATPDVVRGVVGQPITFYPLANDIPGCDPLNRQAGLVLASPVADRLGLSVQTDLVSFAVTVVADGPGAFFLDYTAGYGALFATGKIRVDVSADDTLMALPDSVVVRGTVATLVDVLANDHDPQGSVLTVLSATADDPDRIQLAVVAGRWLHVKMQSSIVSTLASQVEYVVTNGRGEQATGRVEVIQAPAVEVERVSVVDDHSRVRIGDVVSIPVLANDSSWSGEPLVLNDNVPGMAPGQLRVEDPSVPLDQDPFDLGQAFVDGKHIRYQAPTTGDDLRRLRIEYQAGVAMGSPVTGYVWVDLIPEPVQADSGADETSTQSWGNHAPTPQPIEARVVVGDTIRVPVQIYGQDPDGDSVTVAGLRTPPKYGRVVSFTANSLTYESYPEVDSPGTDSFEFYVQDRFGAVGIGTVRIGLSPPTTPAPPLAVNDVVTARPGSQVTVFPSANDIIPVGSAEIAIVVESDPAPVLDPVSKSLLTTAPAADDPAVSISYHLDAGGVAGASADVLVRSQEGYTNPPRVYDHVAEEVVDSVAFVDVLDNAWDVDGASADISIVSVGGAGSFNAGVISVPVLDRGQIIPFVVTDGDGAEAMAVVFVPAETSGRPELRSGGLIAINQNGAATVSLNDYITSPRRPDVYLTMESQAWTSPQAYLGLSVDSNQRITLTAQGNYIGPAALTVEVRDSADATDPEALTGVVTIPVQIGAVSPVLWCPGSVEQLIQGGPARQLDIARLCHVWMPDPPGVQSLRFTGSWALGGDSITLSGRDGERLPSDLVQIQAGINARPGAQSVLTVGVDGYPEVSARIPVEIVGAPKPTITVSSVTDVRQGTLVEIPVIINSPMLNPMPTIVNVTQSSGPGATVAWDARTIRITPGETSHGVLAFDVTGSDISDPSRTDRQVTGSFTVTVYGVPDPPSPPQPAMQLRSRSAVVSYVPGADNGAPIQGYEVSWGDTIWPCGLNTTCEITGLTNGESYSFQVRAINKAGASAWSDFGPPVMPNAIPGAVQGFSASAPGCATLTLSWTGAAGDGTSPTAYHLSWASQSEPVTVAGRNTSYRPTGLDNNTVYEFTILAENIAGLSQQPVSVTGQSSCRPLWSTSAAVAVSARDMGDTAQVLVSWPRIDPQGPGPVTYQVTRSGPDGTKTFTPTTETSLGDTGDEIRYDGQEYTYTVTATNATGGPAHTSTGLSTTWKAVGRPDSWTRVGGAAALSVTATGVDREATISVLSFPPFRDATGKVLVTHDGTQVATLTANTSSITLPSFTNGADLSLSFTACNTSGACNTPQTITLPSGPFGPLAPVQLSASQGNGREVCVSATGNGNGRPARLVITADNSIGEVYHSPSPGSGQITNGTTCVDARTWDTNITFTAHLETNTTSPSRTDSPTKTASIRSAVGVPDDWPAGQITIVATGSNGGAKLTVPSFPQSNGGTLTVSYRVGNDSWMTIANPGDVNISGLINGSTTQVQVRAHNGTNSNNPSQVTVVTYGSLSAPSLVAMTGDGTKACVKATTPSNGTNGRPATLVIKVGATTVWSSNMRDGSIDSGTQCYNTGGYNRSATFTAQLITQTGLGRSDSAVTTITATSPPSMPSPLAASQVKATATGANGTVTVQVTSFPANTTYVRVEVEGKAVDLKPGSASATLNGFINGHYVVARFIPCNPDQCNPAGIQNVNVTPYGPLSSPSFDPGTAPSYPDTKLCVVARANGNGAAAKLTIINSHNGTTKSASGSDELVVDMCITVNQYAKKVTFTATLTDASGNARAAQSKDKSLTTAPSPKITAAKGTDSVLCSDGKGQCKNIIFTMSNFPPSTYGCAFYWLGSDSPSFTFAGKNGTYNTMDNKSGSKHYGKGNYKVTCSSMDSRYPDITETGTFG